MSINLANFQEKDSAAIRDILSNIPHNSRGINYAQLIASLEPRKLETLARIAEDYLRESAGNKMLIVLWRLVSVETLSKLLARYQPLIIRPISLQNWQDFIHPESPHRLVIITRSLLDIISYYDFPNTVKVYSSFGLSLEKFPEQFKERLELIYDSNNQHEIKYTARLNS